MELRRYLSLLKKWGWLILLITGLAAAGSYFYSRTIPPTYRTTAVLLVGQEQQSANPTPSEIYVSNNLAQAYALLVNQPSVLQAAAKELNWEGSWESLYFVVTANAPQGGQTFNVSATAGTPQRAQEIANEIARQVILQSPISQQQKASDDQRAFITEQQALMQSQIVVGQKQLTELSQQAALETDQAKLDNLNTRISALQTKIENWQRTYLSMGTLLNQSTGKYLTVIAPAPLPAAPVSPNILQNVLLAAAVGLVLAVGVVLLLEYLDDTIKSSEDVERVLQQTTLASVARISPIRKPGDNLITLLHPRSPIAEEYRSLRTNLRYSGIENPGGALLVTSANPSEGKTTTAANLAVAMAQSGKRVILLDADLRRPGIHPLFGLSNQMGLMTLFWEETPRVEEVMQTTDVPGLRVIAAGEPPPNPAEILDSKRMTEILVELRSQADMVVVDSPPLLVVADANILASRCSGAIIVMDSGRTRTDAARKVVETLTRSKVKILGIVLNRVSGRRGGYYNNYYYYASPKSNGKAKGTPALSVKGNGHANGNGHTNGNGAGKTETPSEKSKM
ncbi:MAG: polysaccharide biosynthesis tyrosine autokinase [Chloroflexota bacterium]|nr:MAG: polysaccharide biosynthesis tyrosine autokinase [Chloroflexota bacterium]